MFGWLVVFRIYVALAVLKLYRDLEAGDNQSLKFKWRGGELNPRPRRSASQELNHSDTAAFCTIYEDTRKHFICYHQSTPRESKV